MIDHQKHSNKLNWLLFLRRYIALIAIFNIFWEMLQMPLYTMWNNDTWGTIIYSIIHCSFGDVLIALTSISLAILIAGKSNWPIENFRIVAFLTIIIGISYTFYSEWLNIYIHQSWAYTNAMPTLTIGPWDFGATPLLQWLIIPSLSIWLTKKTLELKCN